MVRMHQEVTKSHKLTENDKTQFLEYHFSCDTYTPYDGLFWIMVFYTTFKNISGISWRSGVLVDETGVPAENHRYIASHWQTLSNNVISSTPRHELSSKSQC